MTDEALIQQYLAGESDAFNLLAGRHGEMIYRLAYRLLGNREDAEDAVQEVHLRLLRALPKFRATCRFTTWLYRLASNTCIDLRRRRISGLQTVRLDPGFHNIGSNKQNPENQCELAVREGIIHQALQLLPEAQRLILILHDKAELSNQEVAAIMGLEVGALKSRLHRARAALKRVLEAGVTLQSGKTIERVQITSGGTLS